MTSARRARTTSLRFIEGLKGLSPSWLWFGLDLFGARLGQAMAMPSPGQDRPGQGQARPGKAEQIIKNISLIVPSLKKSNFQQFATNGPKPEKSQNLFLKEFLPQGIGIGSDLVNFPSKNQQKPSDSIAFLKKPNEIQ